MVPAATRAPAIAGTKPCAVDARPGATASTSAKPATLDKSTAASRPPRIRAPINPSPTRTAKRRGAPVPFVTEAAIQSASRADATHRTTRAVEPAGMIPQVAGPERQHCPEAIKPPAATGRAPAKPAEGKDKTARPAVSNPSPRARPLRPSASTTSDAPSQARMAAATYNVSESQRSRVL
jgi:hypothetical protein